MRGKKDRTLFVVASIVFLLLIGYTLNKVGENGLLLIEELTGEKDNCESSDNRYKRRCGRKIFNSADIGRSGG